ncbi:tetratricopeptide repeat protein [Leptospira wolffii]|uniref:Tetratricopeptide repeat protein n=1 Tax=Leptospira wolffii TaxID=409998 RepID=A0A2M9ZAY1_9LEPT|nr:putative lipoprotein [Leptospira wolffii serovar Khorat str. Khorat-H2]PJZ65568.1 hypothetical protein CH371_11565 [Leptospira wolffii]TGK56220.1 hypothetical protein EHQ32_17570 [Leptospira wolffii]TGK72267.1 hypothetical protein EHQ35_13005 [Leptospira wolffii]TGK72827.1 hypothetical protein EHQ27_07075 [Leptospira wolffii]
MSKYFAIFLIGAQMFLACASAQKEGGVSSNLESQVRSEIKGIDQQLSDVGQEDKKRSELLLEKAKLLLKIESFKEASLVLKELQNSKEGRNLQHLDHYLGSAYLGINDYDNAIVHFRKSDNVDRDFESVTRKKMWAKAYFEDEKYGQALGVLGRASREKNFEKDLFYYETVVVSFYRIKEYKRCQLVLEEGLQKFPESLVLRETSEKISQILPR